MAELTTSQRLRGLVLSATELRAMTDWSEALIEDYLNLFENFILLADEIDTKNNIVKTTTVVTAADSPYTPLTTDEEIFINTDAGDINITLPLGINGTNYRMINSGSSGNKAHIIPALAELLNGANESDFLLDTDVVILTFEDTEGWY